MFRSACLTFAFAALLSATPALAAKQLPLRFVTVDGAWDCVHQSGEAIGTLVVADKTYAFLGTDGIVAGYGKLHRIGEEQYDLPHYIILDGHLKDTLGFSGTTMRGPKGDYENYANGIFLVLLKPDFAEAECTRRQAPDA